MVLIYIILHFRFTMSTSALSLEQPPDVLTILAQRAAEAENNIVREILRSIRDEQERQHLENERNRLNRMYGFRNRRDRIQPTIQRHVTTFEEYVQNLNLIRRNQRQGPLTEIEKETLLDRIVNRMRRIRFHNIVLSDEEEDLFIDQVSTRLRLSDEESDALKRRQKKQRINRERERQGMLANDKRNFQKPLLF